MQPSWCRLTVFGCALAGMLTASLPACSVDANVGTIGPDASEDAPSSDGNGGGDDGAIDRDASSEAADVITPADAGCGVSFAQKSGWIELLVVQATPPPGQGGTIQQGTYVLTALNGYFGAPQGTEEMRETLVITGSPTVGTLADLIEARNTSGGYTSYPSHGVTANFHADSPTMSFQTFPTCGDNVVTAGSYTASGTTLSIVKQAVEYVYTRLP